MNLDSYNQKLIAVFGTIALLVLAGGALWGGIGILSNVLGGGSTGDTSLIADNGGENSDNKPTQTVSFQMPILIDSVKKIYLVPVSQLNEPEVDKDGTLLDDYPGSNRYYKKYKFAGSYNNIIVFDERRGSKTPVFTEKIHVSHFENALINGKFQILAIKGARQDTNNDGKLNASDLESFFVYNIDAQILKEYREPELGVSNYQILYESNKIVVAFIKDLNKSGEIDFSEEPQLLKILDLDSGLLQDFADDQMQELLHKTIN